MPTDDGHFRGSRCRVHDTRSRCRCVVSMSSRCYWCCRPASSYCRKLCRSGSRCTDWDSPLPHVRSTWGPQRRSISALMPTSMQRTKTQPQKVYRRSTPRRSNFVCAHLCTRKPPSPVMVVWGAAFCEAIRWPGTGSNRRPSDFQSDARTN